MRTEINNIAQCNFKGERIRNAAAFEDDRRAADLIVQYVEVEAEQVDGNGVLAGVVLLDAGEERLREEEPGQPEHRRRIGLEPVLQEPETSQEVVDVAAERLQRRVGLLHPHTGYLALPRGRQTSSSNSQIPLR